MVLKTRKKQVLKRKLEITCIDIRKSKNKKWKFYYKIWVIEIWFLFFDFFKLKLLLICYDKSRNLHKHSFFKKT